jgi:hypothetical protein
MKLTVAIHNFAKAPKNTQNGKSPKCVLPLYSLPKKACAKMKELLVCYTA